MLLFSPVTLGALALSNRVVMAPLTRVRAGESGIANDLLVEHYRQRATTGLIVSEGTYTSAESQAFVGQPGIVTPEQIAGWLRVTDAVHEEGGLIVAQLMHGGRVTHPDVNGGHTPVAPSAIAIEGSMRTAMGPKPFPVPHALELDELPGIVAQLAGAARNAIEAGFDGVEVHSANGYLLHEFLSPASNVRDDLYGGSPENRARLGIEVLTAVAAEIGADRVGVRISPSHNIQDALETDDAETRATYEALLTGIAPLGLAYVSVLHADPAGEFVQHLRSTFGGAFVANSGFGKITTREEAIAIVEDGFADAVAIGRPVIANPDLVRRWSENLELNEPNAATFYGPGAEGYTDYPALAS
ncbi:2,4-dienoyl-CoA reductase-like NADH-dependent reductase (Old Yellow Enzyme family) [Glaciihabitans tibetensis]|uniref:2,4-dienoyl-CoA reductase-like NADH-dependent reductase (Old Yellow Enzyme family) n=1 Tax=Glaciihabitans tibetensis TaxID=1266600 RepID=A0A2T0VA66_9MICO|nr:alkene reductase [Glaciihabitans tibetensis]PRY67086.1 2,4-dienoyl-CoA reductase-like NADH-dependent reductase (Old Yellow Enzyme family) [Glaciihabitans tibetensis]